MLGVMGPLVMELLVVLSWVEIVSFKFKRPNLGLLRSIQTCLINPNLDCGLAGGTADLFDAIDPWLRLLLVSKELGVPFFSHDDI